MTEGQLISLAAHRRPLPGGLNLPQIALYEAIGNLYGRYSTGGIGLEEAKTEKSRILSEYKKFTKLWEIYQDTCRLRVELERTGLEMEKNQCPFRRALDGRSRLDGTVWDANLPVAGTEGG